MSVTANKMENIPVSFALSHSYIAGFINCSHDLEIEEVYRPAYGGPLVVWLPIDKCTRTMEVRLLVTRTQEEYADDKVKQAAASRQ